MYAYARTYAHMYADICVYIPIPVPVQRVVIRGTNDKKTILRVEISRKKNVTLYTKYCFSLFEKNLDLQIHKIFTYLKYLLFSSICISNDSLSISVLLKFFQISSRVT